MEPEQVCAMRRTISDLREMVAHLQENSLDAEASRLDSLVDTFEIMTYTDEDGIQFQGGPCNARIVDLGDGWSEDSAFVGPEDPIWSLRALHDQIKVAARDAMPFVDRDSDQYVGSDNLPGTDEFKRVYALLAEINEILPECPRLEGNKIHETAPKVFEHLTRMKNRWESKQQ